MTRATRSEKLLAVLFLDLDGFKNINDTLAMKPGRVLRRLQAGCWVLRQDDVVGRQGGDEFTLLLQGVSVVQASCRLRRDANRRGCAFPFGFQQMHVTRSIGVHHIPVRRRRRGKLLRNADTAMYQAKEDGKTVSVFTRLHERPPCRRAHGIETVCGSRWSRAFRCTTSRRPSLKRAVVGVEALLRWKSPGARA